MADRITAEDLVRAVGPRKARAAIGLEPVGDVTPKKRHKYGVAPKAERTCDGIVFDSKKEMNRWNELRALEAAGLIRDLERQFAIPLHVNGLKIGEYRSDFRYREGNELVVEDTKGGKATQTPLYRWKVKHVAAEYGITVRET